MLYQHTVLLLTSFQTIPLSTCLLSPRFSAAADTHLSDNSKRFFIKRSILAAVLRTSVPHFFWRITPLFHPHHFISSILFLLHVPRFIGNTTLLMDAIRAHLEWHFFPISALDGSGSSKSSQRTNCTMMHNTCALSPNVSSPYMHWCRPTQTKRNTQMLRWDAPISLFKLLYEMHKCLLVVPSFVSGGGKNLSSICNPFKNSWSYSCGRPLISVFIDEVLMML